MEEIIEISTSTLDRNATEMSSSLKEIRNDLKAMFEAIIKLDSMWDGPANDAFNRQYIKDQETLSELCNSMDRFIDCMQYASSEYSKCENSIEQSIAAIRI